MSKERKKRDPVILLLDLIIFLMIFVMLAVGFNALFFKNRADERSFSQDAGMMSFNLQRGDYAALIQGKYINEFNGYTETAMYHALADYIEAASLYKVYAAKKDDVRAEEQKAVMAAARAEMGELTVFADKADEMFGVGGRP